jgi:hypothetical protein
MAGNSKLAKIDREVMWGQIICVEAFSKQRVKALNEQITTIRGFSTVNLGGESDSLTSDHSYVWSAENLEECFASVLEGSTKFGGSVELLRRSVSGIRIESLDSQMLPFYVVVIRVHLNRNALAESPNLAKDLAIVRNSFRVFMEGLNGCSRAGHSMSPCVPAITVIASYVREKELNRLREKARRLETEGLPLEVLARIGDEHRDAEPFDFDPTKQKDMKSHFLLEPNISLIMGNADPYSLPLRTPYITILSSTKELLSPEPLDMPVFPFATNLGLNQIWFLPNTLAIPVGLLSWFEDCLKQIDDSRKGLIVISHKISSNSMKGASIENLGLLTETGIMLSSLAIGLDALERNFGKTFLGWADNNVPGQREILVPSTKHWHSSRDPVEFKRGYLTALGRFLRRDFDTMRDQVDSLEREVTLLAQHANQAEIRRSVLATEASTSAMEKTTKAFSASQKSIEYLTAVVIALTAILVIISVFSADMGAYTPVAYAGFFSILAIVSKRTLVASAFYSVAVFLASVFLLEKLRAGEDAVVTIAGAAGVVTFILLRRFFAKNRERS